MEKLEIGQIVRVKMEYINADGSPNFIKLVPGRIEDIDKCADGTYAMFEGQWIPVKDISIATPDDIKAIETEEKATCDMKNAAFRMLRELKEPEFI